MAMTGTDVVNIIREFGTQAAIVVGGVSTLLLGWGKVKEQLEQGRVAAEVAASKVADTAQQVATVASTQMAEVKNAIEQTVGTQGDGSVRATLQQQDEKMAAHIEQTAQFRRDIKEQVGGLAAQVGALNTLMIELMVKISGKPETGVAE